MNASYLTSQVYIDGEYKSLQYGEKTTIHEILTNTLGYDGNSKKYYINGIKEGELQCVGTIGFPTNNTGIAIGVNPDGSGEPDGGYTDMEVYGVRIYNRGLTEEEVAINTQADNRRFKQEEVIPVYTEEQVLKMGSGENVYVQKENKTYTYSTNAKYEYQNNIEMQIDYTTISNKIKAGEIFIKLNKNHIKSNDNYYTYKSQYTIAENKYGYVKENLQLLLDGIDNTGSGHSTTTPIWKDLSGNNRDGTLTNMIEAEAWKDNGLMFEGNDDIVVISPMNYNNITLETVAAASVQGESYHIMSNIETGGYAIYRNASNRYLFEVYLTEYKEYIIRPLYSGVTWDVYEKDVKCSYSGSYNGSKYVSRSNNAYEYMEKQGSIGTTQNGTYMVLGSNPSGTTGAASWFNGTIYSARVYDRALTDEEMSVNYLNDKDRYQV